MLPLLLILSTPARAASPWTLPEGAWSIYGGGGVSTFATGLSGWSRDRYVQVRAVGWFGVGVSERTQLEVSVPLAYTAVIEDPAEGPCPTRDDYCAPSLAPGTLEVATQTRLSGGKLPAALRFGLRTDVWNAPRRGRWTNPGQGTVEAVLDGLAEVATKRGDTRWVGQAQAGLMVPWPRPAEGADGVMQGWAPAPSVRGALLGRVETKAMDVEVGLGGQQRLWGATWGTEWVDRWRPVIDRWRVTRWGELRPRATVSLHLSKRVGVHLGASRSLAVVAGPPDLWDVSLGVHHYRPRP